MYPIIKPDISFMDILKILFSYNKDPIAKFELEFAKKYGFNYAISFPYARTGLYSIFKALKIRDSNILMPAYTCIVVPNAVVLSGNKPVFADSDFKSNNMHIGANFKQELKKFKVFIPTHMFGNPMHYEHIKKDFNGDAIIIEDCCLALNLQINGKSVGKGADFAMFSFNISKQMTTFDGGMIVTDNKEYYDLLLKQRDKVCKLPSWKKKFKVLFLLLFSSVIYNRIVYGFMNFLRENLTVFRNRTNMDNWAVDKIDMPGDYDEGYTKLQAKIGLSQIRKIDDMISKKAENVKLYDKYLSQKFKYKTNLDSDRVYSHYNLYIDNREDFIKYMRENGVNIGLAMDYSVPSTSAYKKYSRGEYKNSDKIAQMVLNLPIYNSLNKNNIKNISKIANKFLKKNG